MGEWDSPLGLTEGGVGQLGLVVGLLLLGWGQLGAFLPCTQATRT